MRTIKDVETVGLYADEIRIMSKHEEPVNLKRGEYYPIVLENVKRIKDMWFRVERRIAVEFESGSICVIEKNRIYCGKNPLNLKYIS